MRTVLFWLTVFLGAVNARGQVVSWEGNSFPEGEGWTRSTFCTPERSIENGELVQILVEGECIEPPDGDRDSYTRSIGELNGSAAFFYEYRVQTDGDRSEIPGGAPTLFVLFNSFGISYNATVARDQIKLVRDVQQPILFFDLTPGVPHTIRLELFNDPPSENYRWYVDGVVFDEGLGEGPYPVQDATIGWRGKSWFLPCENRWNYIRYGIIPVDGSGDFDSDGDVADFDLLFFVECLDGSGDGVNAGPGCRWADFDGDTDVDCTDWDAFDSAWTGAGNPAEPAACAGEPIPAVATWGMVALTLVLMTGGTVVIRRRAIDLLP